VPASAAPVRGLVIASAAAAIISQAAPAGAQTPFARSADGAVSVDLSVLNGLGAPQTVPQVLQPSVRSLLMPNASGRRDVRLQQLVPPNARTAARPAAPRVTAPSRPAPTRMARPSAPTAAPPAPPAVTRTPPAATMTPPAALPPAMALRAEPAPAPVAPPAPPPVAAAPMPAPAPPPAPPAMASAPPPAVPAPPPAVPAPPPVVSVAPPKLPKPPKSEPMPLKAAPEPPRQTASLPPSGGAIAPGREFRLSFDSGEAAIRDAAKQTLDGLAGSLKSDSSLRLQLMAYAGGDSQTASQARRLSLSRGLAVRKYLIDKGISSTRIDVRALGNKFESGPSDRVDVVVTAR
jgi:outer membrane protein OmpA-like peptidoglycan-associated protein